MRTSFTLLAVVAVGVLTLFSGCPDAKPAAPAHRTTLNRLGGTTFELVPVADQEANCLVYTVARNGITRILTRSKTGESIECPAGKVISGHAFKVPLNEGPVHVYVLFTSQKVKAQGISRQLVDGDRQHLTAMDLRLPGNASLDTLDFVPEEDVEPMVGEAIDVTAPMPADAGTDADGG